MPFLEQDIPIIYLKPGEIHFSHEPSKIITILGSCVSIIMYNKYKRIGAICHAVMPSLEMAMTNKRSVKDAFQYVDSSVEWMLSRFEEFGIKRGDIEVKIFGGAEIFFDNKKSSNIAVGRKNVEAAVRIIKHKELKLRAWNVGGNKGRKLIFHTDTGEVFTKFVRKVDIDTTIIGTGKAR
jgi:chemotaxis protein CheD